MADPQQQSSSPPADDGDVLDLRHLAQSTFDVLTSAGRLTMRRTTSLGPLDRTRVAVQQRALVRAVDELDRKVNDKSGDALVERLSAAVTAQEDALLRIALVDATDEQLAQLDAPERAGILSAFFGATPAEARRVVAGVVTYLTAREAGRSRGTKRSRASSGSTAATPSAG